jgi:Xaa-Pro aminopeptidase
LSGKRAARLAELVAERGLDGLLVGDLVRPGDSGPDATANVRWLTGFSGTSGLALLGPDARLFFTDFRYVERAAREVDSGFERVTIERQLVPETAARLRGRVGFDDALTSVKSLERLREAAPEGVELVAAGGLVERLRRAKDGREGGAMAAAARIADQVYDWLCERGFEGRTEAEVALAAEVRMRELGAEGPAFPPIVAAAENSAVPHHDASGRVIGPGELLLIDIGAKVDGYCSDCTRMFAVGEVGEEEREAYRVVLEAQTAALRAVGGRVGGREADAVARNALAAAGTASGSRSTRRPASASAPTTSSPPATPSPSSPASTSRAGSASASRTW